MANHAKPAPEIEKYLEAVRAAIDEVTSPKVRRRNADPSVAMANAFSHMPPDAWRWLAEQFDKTAAHSRNIRQLRDAMSALRLVFDSNPAKPAFEMATVTALAALNKSTRDWAMDGIRAASAQTYVDYKVKPTESLLVGIEGTLVAAYVRALRSKQNTSAQERRLVFFSLERDAKSWLNENLQKAHALALLNPPEPPPAKDSAKGSTPIAEQFIYRDVPDFGRFLAQKYIITRPLIEALAVRRLEREGQEITAENTARAFTVSQSSLAAFLKGTYASRTSGQLQLTQMAEDVLAISEPTDVPTVKQALLAAHDRRHPETAQQKRQAEKFRQEAANLCTGSLPADFRATSLDRCVLALWAPDIIDDLKTRSKNVRDLAARFDRHVLRPAWDGNLFSEDEARNDAVSLATEGRDRDIQHFLGGRYAYISEDRLGLTVSAQHILVAAGVKDLATAERRLLQAYAEHHALSVPFKSTPHNEFAADAYEHKGPPPRLIEHSVLFNEAPEIGVPLQQACPTFSALTSALVKMRLGKQNASTDDVDRITREVASNVYFTLDGAYGERSDEGDWLSHTTISILAIAGVEETKGLTLKLLTLDGQRSTLDPNYVVRLADEAEEIHTLTKDSPMPPEPVEPATTRGNPPTVVEKPPQADLRLQPREVKPGDKNDFYEPELDEAYFVQRLLSMRTDATNRLQMHTSKFESLPQVGSDDRSTEIESMEAQTRMLNSCQRIIGNVDAALKRIRAGTYGICEDSGDDIPLTRLIANPFAVRTIEAEEARDFRQKMTRSGSVDTPHTLG